MGAKMSLFGVSDLLAQINDMGASIDDAARETLEASAKRATSDLKKGIGKHRRTGKTEEHLRDALKVESSGSKFTIKVGFELPEGLPARYINKGTPTNKPDPFVDRALNRTKLRKEQEEFLQRVIRK